MKTTKIPGIPVTMKDKLRWIRRESIKAHDEYCKKMEIIHDKLNKMINEADAPVYRFVCAICNYDFATKEEAAECCSGED